MPSRSLFRFRRLLLILVFMWVVPLVLQAQQPAAPTTAPAGAPKLVFIPETRSVGIVSPWTVKMFDLIIANQGDADLIIKEAAPSCSCTTVGAFEKVIKPGTKSKIKITFNSRNIQGMVKKSVLVASNDPVHPVKEFVFTAFVQIDR